MEARTPFSAGDFRRRAANLAASAATEGEDGDHRLNPDLRHLIVRPGLRDAAVLIGVVDHGDDATVLLTKRTETMRSRRSRIVHPLESNRAATASSAAPPDTSPTESIRV